MKKFSIHPLFLIVLIVLFFLGLFNFAISCLLSVFLHEIGHGVVAKKLGYSLNKICILPYGACLSYEEFAFKPKDEIKIAIAGPLTNVALFLLCISIWWIFPETYNFTYNFVFANITTAIFNFLPAYPLDGARIFIAVMSEKNKRKLAYAICSYVNLAFSVLLLVMFVVSAFFQINITFGIMAIFLFMGTFEGRFQGRYSPLLFNFSKSREDKVLGVKSISVPSSACFFEVLKEFNSHKYNLVYVRFASGEVKRLSESQIKRLIEKFSLDSSFDSVFMISVLKR